MKCIYFCSFFFFFLLEMVLRREEIDMWRGDLVILLQSLGGKNVQRHTLI